PSRDDGCVSPARWSRITEARIGLEVEVEAGLVLELHAPHLPISLAHHDHLRCDDRRDLELLGESFLSQTFPQGASRAWRSSPVGLVLSVMFRSFRVGGCKARLPGARLLRRPVLVAGGYRYLASILVRQQKSGRRPVASVVRGLGNDPYPHPRRQR